MEPVSITVTGFLANDPREFSTDRGPGVSLWLQVPLSDDRSRYLKVTGWGPLATHAAASLHKNDRVTVRGSDFRVEQWTADDADKSPRACLAVTAWDIAPSLLRDTAVMGRTARRAGPGTADAGGEHAGLPAAEQADLKVLAGVTADA
ncbi:MAG TPA: hypothetical protein VFB06_02750 [Streptosporangiaceae bacterium]|nr:hypothetical protein [Streptosporangiaceae bacterium]